MICAYDRAIHGSPSHDTHLHERRAPRLFHLQPPSPSHTRRQARSATCTRPPTRSSSSRRTGSRPSTATWPPSHSRARCSTSRASGEQASERPMGHPSTKSVYVPTVWLPRTHNDFIRTQNNPQVVRADERPGPEPHSGGPAPQRLHRQEVRSSSTGAPSPVLVTHHPAHPVHVCTLTLTTGARSSPSSS